MARSFEELKKLEKIKAPSAATEEPVNPSLLNDEKKVIIDNIAQKGRKDNRKRNWVCVAYPDSAPDNWRDIMDDEHIEWVESPLHDKDVNADGTPKKPHWHVLMLFDGNKSFEQVKEICDKIHATIPQYVQSVRGQVRYFAHLDNPEKAQYKVSEIIAHGGVDLQEMLRPTSSCRYEMIRDMIRYVRDNEVTEYIDFLYFCGEERYDDWYPLLCDSASYVISCAITSQRHKLKNKRKYGADTAAADRVVAAELATEALDEEAEDDCTDK